MNLVKKIFGYANPDKDNTLEDLTAFKVEVNLYRLEKELKIPLFIPSICKFIQEQGKPFEYAMHFMNLNASKNEVKEYFFPIHLKMNFKCIFEKRNQFDFIEFIWDLDSENIVCVEFSSENSGLVDAIYFKESVCKLIYQTKFKSVYPIKNPICDLTEFCSEVKSFNKQKPNLTVDTNSEEVKQVESPKTPEFLIISKIVDSLVNEKNVLIANSGSFYYVDGDQLIPKNKNIILVLRDRTNFDYFLELYNSKKQIIYEKRINSELNYVVDDEKNQIRWVDMNPSQGNIELLVVKFDAFDVCINLKFLVSRCMFETNRKEYFVEAIKKDEIEIANKFMAQEQMEIEEEVKNEYFQNKDEIDFDEEFSFQKPPASVVEQKDPNRTFGQAKLLDRTFTTFGCNLSVYKTIDDQADKMQYITNLPVLKSINNSILNPKKMMLHDQDTKVLMLDESDNKKIFYMDLEKGKVVSEYQADEYNTIKDFTPETKHSNIQSNPVFLAMNEKNLFKIDTRLDSKNSAADRKAYASNFKFTTMTTNEAGNFAIGNNLGEVRLFTKIGQKAKNNYPGLGDPILSIDTSKDGRWVLATCKNYLMLIPTFDEKHTGFTHSIKNVEKATPRILKLHPKDLIKLKIQDVCFVGGRFDDCEKELEKMIVVATNDYVFTWHMKKVLEGKIFNYEYQKVNNTVYNNEFKFNQPERLFIAMENEIRLQKLKKKEENIEKEKDN